MTVAAYLVTQVMACAEIAGLPPVAGLWTVVGPMAVYALLGSSRVLSVGPESTTALMTATAVAPLAAGDPVRFAVLAAVLALLVGVVCLVGWLARAGVLADLLSRPVLAGYLAGIAGVLMAGQLGKLTGVPVTGNGVIAELRSWTQGIPQLHWPTLALGAGVLAALTVLTRVAPRWPGPLLGIVLATGLGWLFGWHRYGIAVVGEVPAAFPVPGPPALHLADMAALLVPALGVSLVGFSDLVLSARAFAPADGRALDAGRELRTLGVANLVAGLSHGFPVSASGSRTAIAVSAGARSQGYSLVALAVVLVVSFTAGPVLAAIPLPALAAVVVFAAAKLVRAGEFRRFAAFRRSEVVLAIATAAGVLALGVLDGVLIAAGLSIMDLMRRVARPHAAVLGYVPGVPGMHDVGDYRDAERVPGVVVYRYDAPICFANAQDFHDRALRAAAADTEWFVLNAESVIEIDVTGLDALERLRANLGARGITFAVARMKRELRDQLAAGGLLDRIGEDHLFPTLPAAVAAYARSFRAVHGVLPAGMAPPVVQPSPMTGTPPSPTSPST